MSSFTKGSLMRALENEDNSSLMDLTTRQINSNIRTTLVQILGNNQVVLKDTCAKLKGYRYVDELQDFKYGSYIRWINLNNPKELRLSNGGIICEIKIMDTGTHILCKIHSHVPRVIQIIVDECLIFQKLTEEERVILKALDYLDK